ncbi:SDR family oxidoreductase [Phyllobacterium sp. CCNWLW109]
MARKHSEAYLKRHLCSVWANPQDIANVIALLCSHDGAWINGQNIFANGGLG